jgi:transposase-like protein
MDAWAAGEDSWKVNNVVEQDHRAVKRVTRPMLGFKSVEAAQCTLAGIELMSMLRKGQWASGIEQDLTATAQFYTLAA